MTLAIVALAVALRVAHVLALRGSPWFEHLVVDPEYYDAWARQIAAGDWLGARPFYMDPLYPYALGALYRAWGRDLLVVRLLQVALSAGSCLLVARIGRRVGGNAVGWLAALGFALYEPEIFYVAEIDKTCLSVFLTSATLALALETSIAARFGAGVALGLAALTRANFLVLAPCAVLAFLAGRPRPRAAAGAVLFAAGVGAALLPVAWRNHRVSGEWVLTTSQAGQNFYTGNNALNPYGAYGALPFVRGNPHFEEADFRAEAEARVGRPLAAREVSAFWFGEAFRHVRAEPWFAARAMLRKVALFWNDFEISDNQDQYLLERDSWVLRLPLLSFGWIAPLALLGALAAVRTRPAVRLLVGFVVLYSTSVIAFFIFSRYRIQVVPALLPLAALGVVEVTARIRGRDWSRLAIGCAVVAVAAWFSFHTIGIFSRHDPIAVDMQLAHLGNIYRVAGQPDHAIAVLQDAVRRCPRCRMSLGELFDTYVATGRRSQGEAYFRTFAREHPGHPDGAGYVVRLREAPPDQ